MIIFSRNPIKASSFHKSALRSILGLSTLLLLNLLSQTGLSQVFLISGGNVSSCSGFLLDSGDNGAPYASNENFTATVCAVAPETIVNLYWTICDLGSGDYIEIYDGGSTAAPLIGTFSGTDLQTTDITSTSPSGCLTVHFVSDGNTVGNFAAGISCGPPCERPQTVITSEEDPAPLRVCIGEEITFDGSATQFFGGASLGTFTWNFDDGTTDNSSWPSVTHSFDIAGGYKVQLAVTDDNGCSNNNLNDYIVFVSTTPNFNLITEIADLCSGGQAFLGVTNIAQDSLYYNDSLNTWISTPWIDLPSGDFGGGLFIPDDQSQCFESSLTFTQFDTGATIDDLNDLDFFHINFEHSFMGDLVITFICPNGQSIAVHQQGGGATYLGEPIDDESEVPGIGYDYYWAPDATNGTWVDESATSGGTLPSGTYQSVAPWSNLLGCPINGTWTIEVCDMFGADNGFIFDWSVAFNPNLYGEVLQFTPIYGPACDSTYWTGPFISDQSTGCDFINITINEAGTYDYVYTAINDFGCTFDTTVSITVDVAPTVTAGEDIVFDCTNPQILLQGGFNEILPSSCVTDGGTFNYTYGNNENFTWTFCPDAGFESSTLMSFTFLSGEMEANWEEIYVYDGPNDSAPLLAYWDAGDATGVTWTATNDGGCITIVFTSDGIWSAADGFFTNPWTYEVACEQTAPPFTWEWTPAVYVVDPTAQSTEAINLSSTQTFTLTGYPVGQPGCASSDDVLVTVTSDISIDVEEFYKECPGDTAHVLEPVITGGTAPYTYKWISDSGEIFDAAFIDVLAGGPKQYCAIVQDICGVADTACTEVSAYPEIPATFTLDGHIGCSPYPVLFTSDYVEYQHVAQMTWHFDDGAVANTMASANHSYIIPGSYYPWLHIIDENGCEFADTIGAPIIVWPTPFAGFQSDPDIAILPNTTFHFNNTSINGESFLWNFDMYGASTASDTSFTFPEEAAGVYMVQLWATNQYGCADSTTKQVIVQDEIDIYIPNAFTPDDDGINDVWLVQGRGFQSLGYDAQIFNRWGERIFQSDDPLVAWTGNFIGGGTFVPDGTYLYRITIRDTQNDVNHVYEGHIIIVR